MRNRPWPWRSCSLKKLLGLKVFFFISSCWSFYAFMHFMHLWPTSYEQSGWQFAFSSIFRSFLLVMHNKKSVEVSLQRGHHLVITCVLRPLLWSSGRSAVEKLSCWSGWRNTEKLFWEGAANKIVLWWYAGCRPLCYFYLYVDSNEGHPL